MFTSITIPVSLTARSLHKSVRVGYVAIVEDVLVLAYAALVNRFRCVNRRVCDMQKYFNREIDYDKCELRLTQRASAPELADGENPIQIYNLKEASAGCQDVLNELPA